jgi:hypothetical protein
MDEEAALHDCLRRMQSGEAPERCAADHPEDATELLLMLAAAARLTSLGDAHLSMASRAQHKARIREALRASNPGRIRRKPWRLWPPIGWGWARGGAAVLVGVALVGTLGLATAVAASVPGEWPYTVRVVIERVPASLYVDPASRAAAELSVSERRLADLKAQLASSGQADPQALAALMAGDRAALQDAAGLPDEKRAAIAARIGQHAQALNVLSEAATSPQSVGSLESAALEAAAMSRDDGHAATAPTGSVEANGNGKKPATATDGLSPAGGNLGAATASPAGPATLVPDDTKDTVLPSGWGSGATASSTPQVGVPAPIVAPTAPPAGESSPVPGAWTDWTSRDRSWDLPGLTPSADPAPALRAAPTPGTGGAAGSEPAADATPAPPKPTWPVPPAAADPPPGTTRGDKGQHVPPSPPSHQGNPPPGRHKGHQK